MDLELSELNVALEETKTTFDEIKVYVFEYTGLHVSSLNIAQAKAKHGIIKRNCYNKP